MTKIKYFCLFIGLLTIFSGCKKDKIETNLAADYDAKVVTDWFDLIKTLTIETPGYTPPVAARAFGYTTIALYEAVQNGVPNRSSLSGKLSELDIVHKYNDNKKYHWPTVANTVLSKMTRYFYHFTSENRQKAITDLYKQFDNDFSARIPKAVYERSVDLALQTAKNIISWSATDGALNCHLNNFPASYTPLVGEQYWQPTSPFYSRALQPYWGANRPFLLENVMTSPPAPEPYSNDTSSKFFKYALEVYETVQNVTDEQMVIAEYWSDDPGTTATPPGHSIAILNQLIKTNNTDLASACEAFAKLGIGISDAFIACWKTKYETNYVRPITFIRKYIDPNWSPILITPPFPEYTSGHSVQSGALAEILTNLYGDSYNFTDRTHEMRTDINGTPRVFSSFYEMADEAALSRLYGGIHYSEAIFTGLEQGYKIGKNINNLNLEE
jgi:hypothetical protein